MTAITGETAGMLGWNMGKTKPSRRLEWNLGKIKAAQGTHAQSKLRRRWMDELPRAIGHSVMEMNARVQTGVLCRALIGLVEIRRRDEVPSVFCS
jgi:hypothetical protein